MLRPVGEPRASRRTRLAAAATMAGWTLLGAFSIGAAVGQSIAEPARRFELLYGVGFLGYLLLVAVYARRSATTRSFGAWLLVGAGLLRVPLLTLPCGGDVNRYLWEGRVQLAGYSPYEVPPDDPRLAELRDEHWAGINHRSYTAIYPPLTMMSCAGVAAVWPQPIAFKVLHTGLDLLAVGLLVGWLRRAGQPVGLAAVYGLCPLTLTAFAGEGHNDSLMIAAAAGAGYALAGGRKWLGSALLGAAVGGKLVAGLSWPWLLRRHRGPAWAAPMVVLILLVPYLGARVGLFGSLVRFGTEGSFLSLYHVPLNEALGRWFERPAEVVSGVSLVLLMGCTVLALRLKDFGSVMCLTLGALLITTPVVHYWYLTWVLAFVGFRPGWAWLGAAAGMGLYFEAYAVLQQTGLWAMPLWVGRVVWGTFLITWMGHRMIRRLEARWRVRSA